MLAQRGVSPRQIAAAAQGARRQGVSVADYLIGNGYVTADTLYRCIAQHLGLPFLGETIPLRDGIEPHVAARRGLAPIVQNGVTGARIVVGPRGAALERLLCRTHPAERLHTPLALTTPGRLEDALRAHAGAAIAAEASESLGKLDPTLSVRDGPTSREASIALTCLATLAIFALMFPLVGGTCLALGFFSAILLRLFAMAMSFGPPAQSSPVTDADLPIYTIIVALYREEAIVAELLRALEELDYPALGSKLTLGVRGDRVASPASWVGMRQVWYASSPVLAKCRDIPGRRARIPTGLRCLRRSVRPRHGRPRCRASGSNEPMCGPHP